MAQMFFWVSWRRHTLLMSASSLEFVRTEGFNTSATGKPSLQGNLKHMGLLCLFAVSEKKTTVFEPKK